MSDTTPTPNTPPTPRHDKIFTPGQGAPVAPDLKRLEEVFGANPAPGVITYAQLVETIGEAKDSNRFRTVLYAWRNRLLKEHNIDTAAERGVGVRILEPDERVSVSLRDVAASVRKVVKSHNRMAVIPESELDRVEAVRRDHALRFTAALSQQAIGGQKDLRKALKAGSDDIGDETPS